MEQEEKDDYQEVRGIPGEVLPRLPSSLYGTHPGPNIHHREVSSHSSGAFTDPRRQRSFTSGSVSSDSGFSSSLGLSNAELRRYAQPEPVITSGRPSNIPIPNIPPHEGRRDSPSVASFLRSTNYAAPPAGSPMAPRAEGPPPPYFPPNMLMGAGIATTALTAAGLGVYAGYKALFGTKDEKSESSREEKRKEETTLEKDEKRKEETSEIKIGNVTGSTGNIVYQNETKVVPSSKRIIETNGLTPLDYSTQSKNDQNLLVLNNVIGNQIPSIMPAAFYAQEVKIPILQKYPTSTIDPFNVFAKSILHAQDDLEKTKVRLGRDGVKSELSIARKIIKEEKKERKRKEKNLKKRVEEAGREYVKVEKGIKEEWENRKKLGEKLINFWDSRRDGISYLGRIPNQPNINPKREVIDRILGL